MIQHVRENYSIVLYTTRMCRKTFIIICETSKTFLFFVYGKYFRSSNNNNINNNKVENVMKLKILLVVEE